MWAKEKLKMEKVQEFFKAIRFGEAFLVSGFGMAGAFFSLPGFQAGMTRRLVFYCFLVWCLFQGSWLVNSAFGYKEDLQNRRSPPTLSRSAYGALSLLFLLPTAGLLFLGPSVALFTAGCYLLMMLYSLPRVGAKYFPFLATFSHFVLGVAGFNMGVALFCGVSLKSLGIGVFFGGLLSAGHLHHERMDRAADERAGIRTFAVLYGEKAAFRISSAAFILSHIYYFLLAARLRLALWEWLPFCLSGLFHAALILVCIRRGLKPLRYRFLYRAGYFAGGLLCVAAKFMMDSGLFVTST